MNPNPQHISDSRFLQLFNDCDLAPSSFTHLAHLRLAWIILNQYGLEQAVEHIQVSLKRYTRFHDASDKYHATVTVAATHIVHHFMCTSTSNSFDDFILANPRLETHFKSLLAGHYSFDIFQSKQAKRQYIKPDILPFTVSTAGIK